MCNKKANGFTLIELLVTTTIIILLSTIGIVTFSQVGKSSRDGKRKADLAQVRSALEFYRQENGGYPDIANYADLSTPLVTGNFIKELPQDPKTSDGYTYVYQFTDTYNYSICALLEGQSGASVCGSADCRDNGVERDGCNYSQSNP